LTVDAEQATRLAREKGWPVDLEALAKHPAFRAHVQAGVDTTNGQLARYETIKKFVLLHQDFTLERGELTPTQKVKRKVVTERYAVHIESMYAEERSGAAEAGVS
jgi:long-chain acyl-CoA synthetase